MLNYKNIKIHKFKLYKNAISAEDNKVYSNTNIDFDKLQTETKIFTSNITSSYTQIQILAPIPTKVINSSIYQ